MRILYGIIPYLLSNWGNHSENLENALHKLLKDGVITRQSRVIAITDIIKNDHDIPAMEIITVGDCI